jgi:hypothetical protein
MDTGNSFGGGNPEINNANQEQVPAPNAFTGFEQLPQQQSIEAPLEAGRETEQGISNQEAQPVFQPPQSAQPQQPQPQTPLVQQAQPNPADKLPSVAGHSNRIEKSWIDKGEKIFAETRDDPYSQKVRVDDLKDEYLAARYGGGDNAA